ncbi:MAG: penicillin-binding transpeptidase domain-containing protein [Tissierellia bacterium]|nr:penicillin-binding transpeptidase domain-containing protein [Tissierellia bacterium]
MNDIQKKRLITVLIIIMSMFVALIVYLSYFQFFKADEYKKSSKNRRNNIEQQSVKRGSFYDRNGEILAYSEEMGSNAKRIYSYPRLYSHIIGYSYKDLGKSALELRMNDYLLNNYEPGIVSAARKYFQDIDTGCSIYLTIDTVLQKKTHQLMKDHKGAAICMNPTTGEIYSMVSMPDFDPSTLKENWEEINKDSTSPLYNRALNGLYPPGSVFKTITATSLMEHQEIDKNYEHTGKQVIDGYTFHDPIDKQLGNIGLNDAFRLSLNTYFVSKSMDLGANNLGKTAEEFMFNQKIPFDLGIKVSKFDYTTKMTKTELASSAIGQGRVLSTPMNMLMSTSAIANGGKIVKPGLIKKIESFDEKTIKEFKTEELTQAVSPIIAEQIKEMMVEVVKNGTGKNAGLKNVQVAGKTGTAQTAGENNAWFIGFAPADNPVVAVVVVLEKEEGSGGKDAAPIARDIISTALNNLSTIQ